jgi:hypothetical protein
MNTRNAAKVSLLVVGAVFVASQASLVWGLGSTSDLKQIYSLRADPACVPSDGTLNVSLRMDCGAVTIIKTKPGGFGAALDGGDGGVCDTTTVAASKAAAALCAAADATPGVACFASPPTTGLGVCGGALGPAITGLADCNTALGPAPVGGNSAVRCQIGGVDSFTIDTDLTPGVGFRFNAERCGACTIKDFEADRDDGGPLYDDPAKLLIRIDPDSATRPFNVVGNAPGAPGTTSFTLTVTAGMTDQQIHQALCDGFAAAGLFATSHDPSEIGVFLDPPSTGWFVRITTPTSALGTTEIGVTPSTTGSTPSTAPNVTLQMEAVPQGTTTAVPTLSEWGMGILVTILLMTGVWMLRRRQRLQQV